MSVSSLSTGHDGSIDLWEVDLFGYEESNESEPPAAVLKIDHGVPAFILAHNNDNVNNASSMVGLPLTSPTDFLEKINQNKHLMINNRLQVERIYNNNSLMDLFSLFLFKNSWKTLLDGQIGTFNAQISPFFA